MRVRSSRANASRVRHTDACYRFGIKTKEGASPILFNPRSAPATPVQTWGTRMVRLTDSNVVPSCNLMFLLEKPGSKVSERSPPGKPLVRGSGGFEIDVLNPGLS